jgi:unsaturated rhamnogalacturonyl hydrolase
MKQCANPALTRKVSACLLVCILMGILSCSRTSSVSQSSGEISLIPLHQLPPAYPVPYGIPAVDSITQKMLCILNYLDSVTPFAVINKQSGKAVTDFSKADTNAILQRGDFSILGYEWGVTYGAMLYAARVTGKYEFSRYVHDRLKFVGSMDSIYMEMEKTFPDVITPLQRVLHPQSLDDAGSICAAMIKSTRADVNDNLRPVIDNYITYIVNNQFRLADGSFARQGPYPHTLWLDDLYMSVPALAQMGSLTGERKYYDDATRQILQFSARMFNKDKKVFMHGWAEEMSVHPEFYWARANGWAIMAVTELLDVLPENYADREKLIDILREHVQGIARYQSGAGLWHQLLDRNDSYLETSASAIYTYCIARAINKGYVDAKVYGPMVLLAWHAITTRIHPDGQVEGTCVGTGMGFDPAFYYYRPQSVYAAHGYGPVLLAGAEVIELVRTKKMAVEGGSVKFYD